MKENITSFIKSLDPNIINQPGELFTFITKQHLIKKILLALKNNTDFRFTILTDLFAADFPSKTKRFEIVYNLLSLKLNMRLILKIHIENREHINSVTDIFSSADWYEREIFDLFGVVFDDHPDLKRILTDYGFVGHPLRKDFPLSGYTQVKYDDKIEKVVYEPLNLEQEFRSFDFASPWNGPLHGSEELLPGDEKAGINTNLDKQFSSIKS